MIVHAPSPSFSSTVNDVSMDPTPSGYPVIAAVGSYVYVAWLNNTVFGENQNVLFKVSNNNGISFGNVVKVSKNPSEDSNNVQIAATGSNVYLVWQQNVTFVNQIPTYDLFFSFSTNNGGAFSNPVDIGTNISGLTDSEPNGLPPHIAASGTDVTVVWLGTTIIHNKTAYNVFAKTSLTGGSDLATVTATTLSTTAYPYVGPEISEVGNYVYVTWTDQPTTTTNPQTYFVPSFDGGSTFPTLPSSISTTKSNQTDLYQAITATGNNVYVAWTNDTFVSCTTCISPDNTMFRAGTNNGASVSFSRPPTNLYKGNLLNDFYPAIAGTGTAVFVAWFNYSQILYRSSVDNGVNFNTVQSLTNSAETGLYQLVMTSSGANIYAAWTGSSPVNSVYFASNNTAITFGTPQILNLSAGSTLLPYTVIASSGTTVYAAWQDDTQGNGDILFRGTVPDVSIASMAMSRGFAYSGVAAVPIIIDVTASNLGSVTASFVVSLKANATFIGTNQTITNLAPGTSSLVQFSWATSGLARGNYTITAYASQVSPSGETNLSNNILACQGGATCNYPGPFSVRLGGDVTNDCLVNVVDLTRVAIAFNSSPGSPGWNPYSDLNNDRTINITDLVDVAINFNNHC